MLRPTTMFMNDAHMKKMRVLAESRGLKMAQIVRIAIAEYLRRNRKT